MLFHIFSNVTVWVCPSVFRVHSCKCSWTCRLLPYVPYIQLVTYRCTDAPFTSELKNFRTSARKSGHGVNFTTSSTPHFTPAAYLLHSSGKVGIECRGVAGRGVQGSGPPKIARTTFVNHANSMRTFSCTPPTPTAPHEIWSVDSQENLWNCYHQMSDFKAKMHQIR